MQGQHKSPCFLQDWGLWKYWVVRVDNESQYLWIQSQNHHYWALRGWLVQPGCCWGIFWKFSLQFWDDAPFGRLHFDVCSWCERRDSLARPATTRINRQSASTGFLGAAKFIALCGIIYEEDFLGTDEDTAPSFALEGPPSLTSYLFPLVHIFTFSFPLARCFL